MKTLFTFHPYQAATFHFCELPGDDACGPEKTYAIFDEEWTPVFRCDEPISIHVACRIVRALDSATTAGEATGRRKAFSDLRKLLGAVDEETAASLARQAVEDAEFMRCER